MHRLLSLIIILVALMALSGYSAAQAQAPGYAEITSPDPGEAVQGLVTIEGSASHPLFSAYELDFTFQDAPLDTWFPIVETRDVQIVDGRLGLWDTTGISDGDYKLRLRVSLENGTTLEDLIEGVRIRNQSAIEPATPVAADASRPTQTPVPPTPTARPTAIAIPEAPGGSAVTAALKSGLIIGAVAMTALGIYLFIRRRIRVRWAIRRMRRMLWQDDRNKRQGN